MVTLNDKIRLLRIASALIAMLTLFLLASATAQSRTVQFIQTDLLENGLPVKLEVILFKPSGDGPFPLLIFNHGSTGLGTDRARIKQSFWTKSLSKFFNKRGWMVAFPQRRGRGKSDGLYDEGFKTDRSKGYSCKPELSLPGAERALQDIHAAVKILTDFPDVNRDTIVMGGVSRGGALAIAYAGRHPDKIKGVINISGGWMTSKCPDGPSINRTLFSQGVSYRRPTLWLYGKQDPYYSTAHIQWVFEIFTKNGGLGQYLTFDVPNANDHLLYRRRDIWGNAVARYLAQIGAPTPKPEPIMTTPASVTSPFKDVPLPDDLTITRPETGLTETQQKLSGLWAGSSDKNWNHILTVEALDKTGGQVIFALGKNASEGVQQGFWVRLESVWKDGQLVVPLQGGRKAVYRLHEPDRLEMDFFNDKGQRTHHARLRRVKTN